jgi:c-di-AMP phosphodiesterase-like protein
MSFNFKNKFSPEKFNIIGLLVLLLLLSSLVATRDFVLGIICFVATFVSVGVSCLIFFWNSKKGVIEYTRSFSEKFSQRSADVFIVADEDDRVVWRSGAYEEYFVIDILKKPSLTQLTSGELSVSKLIEYVKANGDEPIVINLDDKVFKAVAMVETINGKKYVFISLSDITELEDAKRILKEKDLTVAYAMIDNASEAMVYVSEKGREDSLRISTFSLLIRNFLPSPFS